MEREPYTVYGCTLKEWERMGDTGKIIAMVNHITELDEELELRRETIKRLTDRGIEDMKYRIKELERQVEELEEINASFPVCRKHLLTAIEMDGCALCRLKVAEAEVKQMVAENGHLYHACRGLERELDAEDFVRVERDRYIELCKMGEELEQFVAILNAHACGGGLRDHIKGGGEV